MAKCDECDGTGMCVCCDGSGECQDCEGEEVDSYGDDCQGCDGTGECQECYGSGECPNCEGTGNEIDYYNEDEVNEDDYDCDT